MNDLPVAVLLAGGLARRMGGGDKPLRLLGGRPLLDHVLDRIRPQVRAVALNANGDPARFAAWGLPVLPDPLPGNPGPLAGVLAGMRWAASVGAAYVLSVPTDTPFLPSDLVERLDAARRLAGVPIACAASGGPTHPVVALWPVSTRRRAGGGAGGGDAQDRPLDRRPRHCGGSVRGGGRRPVLQRQQPGGTGGGGTTSRKARGAAPGPRKGPQGPLTPIFERTLRGLSG